jgi:CO dehydrogenase nickel-insertion accessory protein CooC1
VAGVDMINFGLYHTCDYLIIVVEPSRNGIRVAQQIKHLCDLSDVNYGLVVNKYQINEYVDQIYEEM